MCHYSTSQDKHVSRSSLSRLAELAVGTASPFVCFFLFAAVKMSTPIQCLVSWKERKKIVSTNGHTLEDVLAAVKATDFGDAATTGRIEVRSGSAFCFLYSVALSST